MLPAAALLCLANTLGVGQTIEVPFRLTDNAILVDATVNGRKLTLVFDTGFGGSVVANDAIDLGPASGTRTLRDFVGEFAAKTVAISSCQIGAHPVQFQDPQAIEQPMGHLSQAYNAHADGILGFQAIEGNVAEINFEKKEFIFHPASYDISAMKPDNKKTFLAGMLPIGANSVELSVLTPEGKRMVMALDTGNAFFATTHRDVLERVGLWPAGAQPKFMGATQVASGPVPTWQKTMGPLTIFGVPVAESYWDVIDLPASQAEGDGTVGIQFLKNFNVTIDFNRRCVWLDNFTGTAGNEPRGELGLVAKGERGLDGVDILHITPDGPADRAGLRVGDRILEINGEETSNLWSTRDVDRKLNGKPGEKVALAVSRGGDLTRYEIERAALLNN